MVETHYYTGHALSKSMFLPLDLFRLNNTGIGLHHWLVSTMTWKVNVEYNLFYIPSPPTQLGSFSLSAYTTLRVAKSAIFCIINNAFVFSPHLILHRSHNMLSIYDARGGKLSSFLWIESFCVKKKKNTVHGFHLIIV